MMSHTTALSQSARHTQRLDDRSARARGVAMRRKIRTGIKFLRGKILRYDGENYLSERREEVAARKMIAPFSSPRWSSA